MCHICKSHDFGNCKCERPCEKGERGKRGCRGPTGPQGEDGLDGPTGPQGEGSPGPTGPQGEDGRNGTNGSTGPTGIPGPTGPPGTGQGIPGPTGPPGTNGTNGTNGATGPTGTPGTNGATGPTGPGLVPLYVQRVVRSLNGFTGSQRVDFEYPIDDPSKGLDPFGLATSSQLTTITADGDYSLRLHIQKVSKNPNTLSPEAIGGTYLRAAISIFGGSVISFATLDVTTPYETSASIELDRSLVLATPSLIVTLQGDGPILTFYNYNVFFTIQKMN